MFFLLRMAFWLCVVCVLLPGRGATTTDANIDTASAISAASAAVSDMRGFCERQPDACVVGGKVAVALTHKAEAGARTIYDFVTNRINDPAAPDSAPRAADTRTTSAQADRGTLTETDMVTPWRAAVPMPPRRDQRVARPSV